MRGAARGWHSGAVAQREEPRTRPVAPPSRPSVPGPADPPRRASTAAIGATVAAGVSLLCALAFFPLAIAVALVVLVVSSRALLRRAPDRRWWLAATVLGAVSLISAVLGVVFMPTGP